MIGIMSIALVLIGIYGVITTKHILKIIVGLNVMEVGINLFIISTGYGDNRFAPILNSVQSSSTLAFVDPLPQALVLTAIVIGVGTTALGLALARKLYAKYGTYDLSEMEGRE